MNLWSRVQMLFAVKTDSVLTTLEDPRQTLEHAYHQQQALLRKVKEGLIDVATSRRQLEQQAARLRAKVPYLEDQAKRALAAQREDLAQIALQRKHTSLVELNRLDVHLAEVAAEERKLTQAEQQFAQRLDTFRARRESLSARYTVAESQVKINESLSGLSGEWADLGASLERAEEKIGRMQARAAAIDALVENGALTWPGGGDPIDQALEEMTSRQAVIAELAALKISQGHQVLESGE